MSPLQDGEKVLDERIFASGYNRQSVSNEENGSLNITASRHQSSAANCLDEKNESPRSTDALEHPSAESTTEATAAHGRSNELSQTPTERTPSELFHFVPETDGSAFNVSSRPPPTPTDGPIPSEKPEPQDQADTYPEGGLRAWLVVLGSFSGMTACFGLLNSAVRLFGVLVPSFEINLSLETRFGSFDSLDVLQSSL